MKYTRIDFITSRGLSLSLENLFYGKTPTYCDFTDAIEDGKTPSDICDNFNNLNLLEKNFKVDRETEDYIRLTCNDAFGNLHFLKIYK